MAQFLQISREASLLTRSVWPKGGAIDDGGGGGGDDDDEDDDGNDNDDTSNDRAEIVDESLAISSRMLRLLQRGCTKTSLFTHYTAHYNAQCENIGKLNPWRRRHHHNHNHHHLQHQHQHQHHNHHLEHLQQQQQQQQHRRQRATNHEDSLFCVANFNWLAKTFQSLLRNSQIPTSSSLTSNNCNMDSHSMLYLMLVIFVYCCVLMRAATAAQQHSTLQQTAATQLDIDTKTATGIYEQLEKPLQVNNISSTMNAGNNNNDNHDEVDLLHLLYRRDASADPNQPDDEEDSSYHDDEFDEYEALINNKSAKGKYIGAPCNDMKCEPSLLHVTCDKETLKCGCARNYPVKLGLTKGCDKPKKLGEQCFYDETCMYNDENSLCVQVRHNAMCQCASGFHSVSYAKPTRRVFCTQDLGELNSDLPTLLGVTTGIAVLAGLICMVLHLFSKTKYPRHRNFGDANLPPPIMYSSDTGIPLTVQSGRPSSRSSLRSSGSIGSYGNRRSSSGGGGGMAAGVGSTALCGGGGVGGGGHTGGGVGVGMAGVSSGSKGILVSTSRTGSRRPSLASVHSTSSSVRSYSMMRFEKEAQQKEIRQEMKLRLARLQQQQQLNQNKPQIVIGDTMPFAAGIIQHHHHQQQQQQQQHLHGSIGTCGVLSRITMTASTPSPLTPNSTDELLPSVDELQEYPPPDVHVHAKSQPIDLNDTQMNVTAMRVVASTSSSASSALHGGIASTSMSAASNGSNASNALTQLAEAAAYIGPCSSSTEAL